MLIITDKAAAKIRSLRQEHGKAEEAGLRISISGGGCSGFQYLMDFDAQKDGDNVFENGESQVFVDPKSLMFINGSVLDFSDALSNGGFQIKNPKATGTCGCGLSFSV